MVEKDIFEILRLTYLTFNEIWGHTLLYEKFASS